MMHFMFSYLFAGFMLFSLSVVAGWENFDEAYEAMKGTRCHHHVVSLFTGGENNQGGSGILLDARHVLTSAHTAIVFGAPDSPVGWVTMCKDNNDIQSRSPCAYTLVNKNSGCFNEPKTKMLWGVTQSAFSPIVKYELVSSDAEEVAPIEHVTTELPDDVEDLLGIILENRDEKPTLMVVEQAITVDVDLAVVTLKDPLPYDQDKPTVLAPWKPSHRWDATIFGTPGVLLDSKGQRAKIETFNWQKLFFAEGRPSSFVTNFRPFPVVQTMYSGTKEDSKYVSVFASCPTAPENDDAFSREDSAHFHGSELLKSPLLSPVLGGQSGGPAIDGKMHVHSLVSRAFTVEHKKKMYHVNEHQGFSPEILARITELTKQ